MFKIWNIFWNQWWRVTWYIGNWELGSKYIANWMMRKSPNTLGNWNMSSTLGFKHGWKRRLIQSVVNMKFAMVKHRYCLIPGSPRPDKELVFRNICLWDSLSNPFWQSLIVGFPGCFFSVERVTIPYYRGWKTIPIYIEVYHESHYYYCHIPSSSIADPVSLHGIIIQWFSGAARSFRRAATMLCILYTGFSPLRQFIATKRPVGHPKR